MNFVICDDDIAVSDSIKHHIQDYISQNDFLGEISVFNTQFSDVLNRINPSDNTFNIYFLDISLNDDINGLTLAKKIRETDINGYIIFITGHIEFAFKIFEYKLKAMDYIFKGEHNLRQRVFDCLDTIKNEISKSIIKKDAVFSFQINTQHYFIPLKDIICFETYTSKRLILAHTIDNCYEFKDTLDNVITKLDSSFYRVHRSYIVNINYITMISTTRNKMYVQLSNNSTCLLSPRNSKDLVDSLKKLT